jgi:hypothetical protein
MGCGHRQQSSVGNLGPMNSCMDEHTSSRGSDGPNGSLHNAILIVSYSSSKLIYLMKLIQVLCKGFASSECRATISHVSDMDHTNIPAHSPRRSLRSNVAWDEVVV